MLRNVLKVPNVKLMLELFGLIVLMISAFVGSYLRLQPVYNALELGYGPTLYEMDPYLNYWITSKLYENGLTYYTSLTQDNPDTKIFWYPWGRDIPSTELPALPYVSIITYYMARSVIPNLTLYEWLVYLPIPLYIIGLVGIYLTVRELSGPLPAAIASLTTALMFVDRQVAGFTVKYVLGLAFIFLALYFHVRAIKRSSEKSALLAGIFLGISALSWAGFNLLLAAIFLQYVLTPLIIGVVNKKLIRLWFYEIAPLTILILVTPSYYNGFEYLIRNAGIIIPLGTGVLLIAYAMFNMMSSKYVRRRGKKLIITPKITYFLLITAFGVLGLTLLLRGFVGIGGKGLAAMGLGNIAGVLTGTIAQYRSATPSEFIYLGGPPLVITFLGILYLLYRSLVRKDTNSLFLLLLTLISIVSTYNVAYFFSYAVLVIAMTSGFIVGEVLISKVLSSSKSGWFVRLVASIMVIFYIIAVVLQGASYWVPSYRSVIPTIIESGVGLTVNAPSWINTLSWIKNNTEKDSVIVAWWDYGYWISVVGERASVADGSTLNFSQIHILAKALTSDEVTAANSLISNFNIKPNKLYVATYEFFIVDDVNKRVYPGPLVLSRADGTPIFLGADGAKGISAIYRIAGVDIDREIDRGGGEHVKIYRYTTTKGYIYSYVLPNWNSSKVREALLYKILIDSARNVWGSLGYEIYDIFTNTGEPLRIDATEMLLFKPSYIAISRITSNIYLVTSLYKLDEGALQNYFQ
ncbi:MAG: STT3 domain-containing protein [Sulfolobales archaeon]